MLIVDNKVVATDVTQESFVCDLEKCKGACCVEGDLGAPLEFEELSAVESVLEVVKPYLSKEAVDALEEHGPYILDEEGDYSTTTIDNKECAFAFYDDKKVLKCSIGQAWKEGKTSFRKPISCHLYPIRIQKLEAYEALNYERWHICTPACDLGAKLKVPVYKFLKEALIRKYGPVWFSKLELAISEGRSPDPDENDL